MLYIFHGSNIDESRKKAQNLVASLRAKKPDAAYDEVNADNWNIATMEAHIGGQGLFSSKYIIFLNKITENAEAAEAIKDFITAMQESANIFIIFEGKLNADLKKVLLKNAEKAIESELATKLAKKEFNIFALGDALGSRDAVRSWFIYREAVANGNEPEGVVGTLFWQVKAVLLAYNAKSAAEAGLNPFVYSKAKSYAKNYSRAEMQKLAHDLVTLYHDGHRGLVDLELGVERWLLGG